MTSAQLQGIVTNLLPRAWRKKAECGSSANMSIDWDAYIICSGFDTK